MGESDWCSLGINHISTYFITIFISSILGVAMSLILSDITSTDSFLTHSWLVIDWSGVDQCVDWCDVGFEWWMYWSCKSTLIVIWFTVFCYLYIFRTFFNSFSGTDISKCSITHCEVNSQNCPLFLRSQMSPHVVYFKFLLVLPLKKLGKYIIVYFTVSKFTRQAIVV